MSQPNENPAIQYIGTDGNTYFYQNRPNGNEYPQWPQAGQVPIRNTPSPSRAVSNTIVAPSYYVPSIMPPNVHQPDRNSLAVPNQRSRSHSRPNINSPTETDRISPHSYTYPTSFSLGSMGHMTSPNLPTSISLDMTENNDSFMSRVFSNHHDEPWNPVRVTNQDRSVSNVSAFPGPNMNYRMMRTPGSDMGSALGPTSDSGYQTQPRGPQSVISNEPERVDQELPSEVFRMPNLSVSSAQSETSEYFPDHVSRYSGRSTGQNKSTFKCPRCQEVSKCPSDFKKHMLKHDKPHVCDQHGCRRAAQGKGFTTINDLQRHKKSVHRIGVEHDSYQCASDHCRNRGKIWPRLDNFKQHINRMHKDEDEHELIRKSQYRGNIPPSARAQADITLAGMQVSGNELDDPATGISLTPDQDENPPWGSFKSGSQKYALEADQMDSNEHNPFMGTLDSQLVYNNRLRSVTPQTSPVKDVRNRQDSLKVLADVASDHALGATLQQRQLSSAPPTKAEQQKFITHTEQQRQALRKFGKALIAEFEADPSADGTDLENVVLRVLAGATQHGTGNALSNNEARAGHWRLDTVLTKTEAMKASQALSNIIKQSPSSPFTTGSRRSSRVSSSDKCQCPHCEVTLARPCDMKKHMKRHTRPYGCTYPRCHKRFGAKSDWKRHENSQHFQMEAFRCQQISPSASPRNTAPCGELFYHIEMFKQHLRSEHKIDGEGEAAEEAKSCKIGKNYQGQFWCGFCERIIKLKEKRNAAWDERFDHIDKHFNKDKKGIEQWLCVEARKTKGEIVRDMDRTRFDEEDGEEDGEGEPDDSPPVNSGPNDDTFPVEEVMSPLHIPPPHIPPPAMMVEDLSTKRKHTSDEFVPLPVLKRRRTDVDRYCCGCGNGPWIGGMYAACISCAHRFCNGCPMSGVMAGLDEGIMLG